VVGVELKDELTIGKLERIIEVARLGVRVPFAADVSDAERVRHCLHLIALAVVEHVGLVRILDRARADRRPPQYFQRLVEVRDEHVDLEAFGCGGRIPVLQLPHRRDQEQRVDEPIRFGDDENDRENERVRIQRRAPPPYDPIETVEHRDHGEDAREQLFPDGEPWYGIAERSVWNLDTVESSHRAQGFSGLHWGVRCHSDQLC